MPKPAEHILLVRHGRTVYNSEHRLNGRDDRDQLCQEGVAQARSLGRWLRGHPELLTPATRVFRSPMRRARQTAGIMARAAEFAAPTVVEKLHERHLGKFTGWLVPDVLSVVPGEHLIAAAGTTYIDDGYGFESFAQAETRGKEAMAEVRLRSVGGRAIVVCHGDIGTGILARHLGIPMRDLVQRFYFRNDQAILLGPPRSAKIIDYTTNEEAPLAA